MRMIAYGVLGMMLGACGIDAVHKPIQFLSILALVLAIDIISRTVAR